jgi:hypothetical protein
MKTLELNQMEELEGGGWSFWAGLTCGATIAALATFSIATAGGAILLAPLLGISAIGTACIITLGAAITE